MNREAVPRSELSRGFGPQTTPKIAPQATLSRRITCSRVGWFVEKFPAVVKVTTAAATAATAAVARAETRKAPSPPRLTD
jgi:hypothetical protein